MRNAIRATRDSRRNRSSEYAERAHRGFSLVELLTVVALISILVGLSGPIISSLKSSGNVNKAALELSLLLEQSRAYAQAKNTYVWVGIHTDDLGDKVTSTAVMGLSGNPSDIGSPDKYRVLQKPRTYPNFPLIFS